MHPITMSVGLPNELCSNSTFVRTGYTFLNINNSVTTFIKQEGRVAPHLKVYFV